MIVLFTDFGIDDPYVGQVKAALLRAAPRVPLVDLLHRAPDFDVQASAHLLDAFVDRFDAGTVFLCVVDPGVGTRRQPVAIRADDRWFVGPDNGLLSVVAARAAAAACSTVVWRPAELSDSFHGRDLFAPVAARLAAGDSMREWLAPAPGLEQSFGSEDLPRVIFVDHYGNAMTGLRARFADRSRSLEAGGKRLPYARVFGEAAPGIPFWYENSVGRIEIAANRASAAAVLGLSVGDPVSWSGANS